MPPVRELRTGCTELSEYALGYSVIRVAYEALCLYDLQ